MITAGATQGQAERLEFLTLGRYCINSWKIRR